MEDYKIRTCNPYDVAKLVIRGGLTQQDAEKAFLINSQVLDFIKEITDKI